MTVRRLADESIQPAGFAFSADNLAWAQKKMAEYPPGRQQSAVIPLLWRAQEQEGWISRPAIEAIAKLLGMAYIRVLEVATFYTMFQLKPVGTRAHIQVCGTTPCMLRGAEALVEVCRHRIHHDPFTTNADGTMSWEEVECIGACVNAPVVMIGKDTYEDLSAERFEEIVTAFAEGRGNSIRPGTQIERQFSAAMSGATTLLEEPTAERTYKPFPPPPPPATPAAGVAPAAASAPAAPPPAAPAPAPSASPAPTTAGRVGTVPEEAAPALKGPAGAAKVSEGHVEAERARANAEAGADGTPNAAMRENATGAESPAGKVDGGKSVDKAAPQALFEAPKGAADNLRLISGIGPRLEQGLNAIGITTYAQVARLTQEQIARLEAALGFKGRVVRDNWLGQAEALARGGVEEYRRVFGKDPH